MIAQIMQYILLGTFGVGVGTAGYFEQLHPRMKFEVTKWITTTKPYYYNLYESEYQANAMLRLQTEWDCYNVITFDLGMRGIAAQGGFQKGILGGNWGIEIRLIGNSQTHLYVSAGYHHESLHATDIVADLGGRAGSEDYYYFVFSWNYDKVGQKDIISLFTK